MVMGDITRIDTVQQYCDLFELLRGAANQTLKETVQHLCCVAERY